MQSKTWLVRSYGLFSSFSTSDSHSSAPRLWLRSLSLSQISISISLSNFFFQWIILQGLYILYNVIVRWLFYFLFLQFDPLLLLLLLFLFWNCERVRVFFFLFSLSLSLSLSLFLMLCLAGEKMRKWKAWENYSFRSRRILLSETRLSHLDGLSGRWIRNWTYSSNLCLVFLYFSSFSR